MDRILTYEHLYVTEEPLLKHQENYFQINFFAS